MNIKKIIQLYSLLLVITLIFATIASIQIYFFQAISINLNFFYIFILFVFFAFFNRKKNVFFLILILLVYFYQQKNILMQLDSYSKKLNTQKIYKKIDYQISGKIKKIEIINSSSTKIILKNILINNQITNLDLQIIVYNIPNIAEFINADILIFNTSIIKIKQNEKINFVNNCYKNLIGYSYIDYSQIIQIKFANNFFRKLNYWTYSKLLKIMPYPYSNIFFAIFTGNTNILDDILLATFQKTGIAHILAISGLHIGIIAAVFVFLFSKLSNSIKYLSSIIIIWLFVSWVNFPASAVRAAIMFTLFGISKLCYKKIYLPNILFVSFIFFVVFEPLVIFQIGFQLSFTAVAGIVIALEFLEESKINNIFITTFFICVFIQILTLPIASYYFKIIPIYGILLNLFVPYLLTFILPIGIISLLISIFSIAIARLFGIINSALIDIIIRMSDAFSNFNLKIFLEYRFTVKQLLFYYFIFFCVLLMFSILKSHIITNEISNNKR